MNTLSKISNKLYLIIGILILICLAMFFIMKPTALGGRSDSGNASGISVFSYYSTSTPLVGAIKAVNGYLNCFIIARTTTGTTTLYDATSTKTNTIMTISPSVYGSFCPNVSFTNGLYASSTNSSDAYTISYK